MLKMNEIYNMDCLDGLRLLDDEGHLQYIKCGNHLYLIGVDGYKITYNDKKKRGK